MDEEKKRKKERGTQETIYAPQGNKKKNHIRHVGETQDANARLSRLS